VKNEVKEIMELNIEALDEVCGGLTEQEKDDIRFMIREWKKNKIDPVELFTVFANLLKEYGDNELLTQEKQNFMLLEWNSVKV